MKKNLKKVFAAGLAASMVLGMSVPAFAVTDESTKTFTKVYESVGDSAVSPAETFEFENIAFVSATETGVGYTEEWATKNLPSIDTVTYAKGDAGKNGDKETTFTVTLPQNYPSVGIYTYSFKEKDNNVEGVDYNDTTMLLKVTVVEDGGYKRVAAMHCEGTDGTVKTGTFTNTYSAGKLSVKKLVTGNMGDQKKEFKVTVTFNASDNDKVMSDITYSDPDNVDANQQPVTTTIEAGKGWTTKTVDIYLSHDETITFNNIPVGVTYTVVEENYTDTATIEENKLGYKAAVYANSDNKTTTTGSGTISFIEEEITTGNGADAKTTTEITGVDADTVTITNEKGVTVDTGISLDALPYLMMLGMSGLGALGFAGKRRKEEDEI